MYWKIVSVFIVLGFVSCGGGSYGSKTVETSKDVKRERIHSSKGVIPIIEAGKKLFQEGILDYAEWKFQDALRMDPEYGPTYYWMAKIKLKKGEASQALSFVEKAKQRVKYNQEWLDKVLVLEKEIESSIGEQ